MTPKQIKEITRNPRSAMAFHTLGRIPKETKTPSTPLRVLIESIPVRLWGQFNGITVSIDLGFSGNRHFNSLSQVATWIGHNQTNISNRRMPYQSWMLYGFNKPVFIEDLLKCCSKHPSIEAIKKQTPKRVWRV